MCSSGYPCVSKQANMNMESTKCVCSKQCYHLGTCQTKLACEKIHRLLPIANCIWMNLMFCCLVRFFFGFKINTIASTGFKGDQFATKIYLEKFHVFSLVRFRFEVIQVGLRRSYTPYLASRQPLLVVTLLCRIIVCWIITLNIVCFHSILHS